jgi:Arc/MetJ-type ribon-helix-helix transcriptional regulator
MAKLTIMIPDELDKRLRVKVAQKYGGKKGALGETIKEAIELWLEKENG